MKHKVLCTAPFKRFPKVVKYFFEIFDGDIIEYMSYSEVMKSINSYDGMIPNARIKVDSKIIDQAKKLKAVYQPSMGYEHISLDYLKENSVSFNALGLDSYFKETLWSTAEHTFSLILSLLKKNYKSISDVKNNGFWDNRSYQIDDIRGSNIGIIGLGNIGRKVAYLSDCFGAKICAYDPYIKESEFPGYVKRITDLDILLINSDIISLHVPFNKETFNMINSSKIALMKDTSYIVNTSRGGIINEKALMNAIKNKNIKGVALDVLENESPYGVTDHPFVKFAKNYNNIIITPHLGGSSYPYMESIFLHSISELKKMLG